MRVTKSVGLLLFVIPFWIATVCSICLTSCEHSQILKPTPGLTTIKNFLVTGMQPVGKTLYVWDGGWNDKNTGSGVDSRTIGVSREWKKFFNKNGWEYDYIDHQYEYHHGLDCSGFVGWAIYNLFNTKSGGPGFVMHSTLMAQAFADLGWGYILNDKNYLEPGDIVTTTAPDDHVWISLGQCEDGSILILHSSVCTDRVASTPEQIKEKYGGVYLCGTTTPSGDEKSDAVLLAHSYMKKYYPQFNKNALDSDAAYCRLWSDYVGDSEVKIFRWTLNSFISDPDKFANTTPNNILKKIFKAN